MAILYKTIQSVLLILLAYGASGQKKVHKHSSLVFQDQFSEPLDTVLWKAEIAPLPGSQVSVKEGNLVLDTMGGVTVWLNKKFKGDIRIEYERTVVVDSGRNDRLSDLNTFWMAMDPQNRNLFTRNGILESYDSLKMYYVGMGGNSNSTTRFRKYEGNGVRTLLQEYKDQSHLLKANKAYRITIEVIGNNVCYLVDGVPLFEYYDPNILKEGYFGFRSTKSRQSIDWIKIYSLN